jgi:hypothetical protein
MSYDELEEQYFLLSQKVKELERIETSLTVRNTELEAENIILENTAKKADLKAEAMSKAYQDETYKTINLKVKIESLEKEKAELDHKLNHEYDDAKLRLVQSAVHSDPIILQQYANLRDKDVLPTLPQYSIHRPMREVDSLRANTSNIILHATDTFGFMREAPSSYNFEYLLHAYAKLGDRVIRYSTSESILGMKRREDFAVTLQQLTHGLQDAIINEYSKQQNFY